MKLKRPSLSFFTMCFLGAVCIYFFLGRAKQNELSFRRMVNQRIEEYRGKNMWECSRVRSRISKQNTQINVQEELSELEKKLRENATELRKDLCSEQPLPEPVINGESKKETALYEIQKIKAAYDNDLDLLKQKIYSGIQTGK